MVSTSTDASTASDGNAAAALEDVWNSTKPSRKAIVPETQSAEDARLEPADRAFRAMGRGRRGKIRVEDVADYMVNEGAVMSPSKAHALLMELDEDNDGNISLEEWRKGWSKGIVGSAKGSLSVPSSLPALRPPRSAALPGAAADTPPPTSPPPSPPAPTLAQVAPQPIPTPVPVSIAPAAVTDATRPARVPHPALFTEGNALSITERHLGRLMANNDSAGAPQDLTSKPERNFSYESLNSVLLAASLTRSWSRRDWPAVRKILFGWSTNIILFYGMLIGFLLYGCELFEPREQSQTTTLTAAGGRRRGGGASSGSGHGGSSHGPYSDSGILALNSNNTNVTVVNTTSTTFEALGGSTNDFLYAWFFSALQRFVLHEPTLILAAKGLPILFASAFCANCVGETIVNLLTVTFETLVTCITELVRP